MLISPDHIIRLSYDHRTTDEKEKKRILESGLEIIDEQNKWNFDVNKNLEIMNIKIMMKIEKKSIVILVIKGWYANLLFQKLILI